MLPDGTHLRAPLLAFVLLPLCTGCAPRGEASIQSRVPTPLDPLGASRPNIRMLIHRQTEQEAKDAVMRALAGSEPREAARRVHCQEPHGEGSEFFRGHALIRVVGADEIAQIFIPYYPRARTGTLDPRDLTQEQIETVLLGSRIDRYESLGMYHLLPGHRFSIILKGGNRIDVQLYVAAPVGSAVAPDGCRYWFKLPIEGS